MELKTKLNILNRFLDIDCDIFGIMCKLSHDLNIIIAVYEEAVCIREGGKPPNPRCWCEYLQYSSNLNEQLINACFLVVDLDVNLLVDSKLKSELKCLQDLYPHKLINDGMRFRFLETNYREFELASYKSKSGQIDDATESSWNVRFSSFTINGNQKPNNLKSMIDEIIIYKLKKTFGKNLSNVDYVNGCFINKNKLVYSSSII